MDITFRDKGQVIFPVKHGKRQKPTQKIIGQDDDEDMDEVCRTAQDAATVQTMAEGFVKGDQTCYVAPWQRKFDHEVQGRANRQVPWQMRR